MTAQPLATWDDRWHVPAPARPVEDRAGVDPDDLHKAADRLRTRLDTVRRDLDGDDWALLLEQLADTITAGQPLREGVAALLEDVIGDALGWGDD